MLSYTDALDEVKCFFFMQKSAYDMRICDWSSDVCSSDLVEPREIGLGRAQFLLGILATDVQPRNPRRFFEQRPALDRLGGDHRADPALPDERGRMRAGGGVGEQQRQVLGAPVAAVKPVCRPCGAEIGRATGGEQGCPEEAKA